jgi:hypothetical protein
MLQSLLEVPRRDNAIRAYTSAIALTPPSSSYHKASSSAGEKHNSHVNPILYDNSMLSIHNSFYIRTSIHGLFVQTSAQTWNLEPLLASYVSEQEQSIEIRVASNHVLFVFCIHFLQEWAATKDSHPKDTITKEEEEEEELVILEEAGRKVGLLLFLCSHTISNNATIIKDTGSDTVRDVFELSLPQEIQKGSTGRP